MKRVLAVLGVLSALAVAQETPVRTVHVWCDPHLCDMSAARIRFSEDGTAALTLDALRVQIVDFASGTVVRERACSVLDVSEGWDRAIVTYERPDKTAIVKAVPLFRPVVDGFPVGAVSERPRGAIFARDGEWIVRYGEHRIEVSHAETPLERPVQLGPEKVILDIAELASNRLVTRSQTELDLWDLDPETLQLRSFTACGVRCAGFAPVGSTASVAYVSAGQLALYDTYSSVGTPAVGTNLEGPIAVSPLGDRILAADSKGTIHVFDGALKELTPLRGHFGKVVALAVSPDSKHAMSSSKDGTLRRWDLETGQDLTEGPTHRGAVRAIAVAADAKLVLTGGDDRTVRLWDAERGTQVACLRGHEDAVVSVALSADGKQAASCDDGGRVILWDLAKGAVARSFDDNGGAVALGFEKGALVRRSFPRGEAGAILPGGRTLQVGRGFLETQDAAGEHERLLGEWDLRDGRCSVVATSDGKRAFVEHEGTLEVWAVPSATCLRTLENTSDPGRPLAISPDGKLGVTENGALWYLDGGWVTETGFAGSAVAFLTSRSLVIGSPSGRIVRVDR